MTSPNSTGFAGKLAKTFIQSKLTWVLVIASLLLGALSVLLTPKEEEPQISVPMIDIQVGSPGLEAKEIEEKLTEPIEKAVWGLEGVEYVYSTSQANGALITVRFRVGESVEDSLVKIHHKILEIRSELPPHSTEPLIKSYSIDDVPFLTLTYTSETQSELDLRAAVATLERELSSLPEINHIEILGGQKRTLRVMGDPERMKMRGVSIDQLAQALESGFALYPGGKTWGASEIFDVETGGRPKNAEEVGNIAIGQRGGQIVRVRDVANLMEGPEALRRLSVLYDKDNGAKPLPAVSLSFTKRKGTNVVLLAEKIVEKAKLFQESMGKDVHLSITRNYGETAAAKSRELIEHLMIATLSVALLIALFMGLRAAIVVVIAVPVTLALTLAIYYFLGYTLNRVTLFALIFSIGILVDDAIVVVENIERHLKTSAREGLISQAINAVSEVGNPTILATFTVIAAILPMAFVRGLMGPYMKPIPIGASLAMILSLLVAFIVTPWASALLLKPHGHKDDTPSKPGILDRIYQYLMHQLLSSAFKSILFGLFTLVLFLGSTSLIYFKTVKVKMLPFDNKNEFQILIDYPSTTSLPASMKNSKILAEELLKIPEITKIQIYTGEAAPFSFSGMVKHVFLRGRDDQADLQVVLTDKEHRKISSHALIEKIRPTLAEFGTRHQALTKILEIPPGPPVLSTILAEIYGPDDARREQAARKVYEVMKAEPSVVDLDTSLRASRPRKIFHFDYQQAGISGVRAAQFARAGNLIYSHTPLGILADTAHPEPIAIELSVENSVTDSSVAFGKFFLHSMESGITPMAVLSDPAKTLETPLRYRKNLKPVVYLMSELSGSEEAPIYGMNKLSPQIPLPQQTAEVPADTREPILKWDGEWFITYEVFRDLGGAFAVVMVLIYVLVLGWFKSFRIPLIIMAPIPISLIGILPGHALTGVYFTATSMIGFIAGAGIIVRNSIILVDFIENLLATKQGLDRAAVREAIISGGVLRFRPMLLTAAAVVVGSFVMLFDPIFQGLAVSLMFGEVAATLISRFAVPVLYFWFIRTQKVS